SQRPVQVISRRVDKPSALQQRLGAHTPRWRLTADSNNLLLSAVNGKTDALVELTVEQAGAIREFSGATSSLRLAAQLFNQNLQLHLVGRKTGAAEWSGTTAEFTDTESVVHDLVQRLSFAEQVVSEANSVVFMLDENGLIQRFNHLAEEY